MIEAQDIGSAGGGQSIHTAHGAGRSEFKYNFGFESYGVRIWIGCNSERLRADAVKIAETALVGNLRFFGADETSAEHSFGLVVDEEKRKFDFYADGNFDTYADSKHVLLKFFDSMLRIKVAENAVSRVFLHAGVVAWKDKAIILPARSFQGKSTLTLELVKKGAEYYSDDFAVLDADGLVHPFPRLISMRRHGESIREDSVNVRALGGQVGHKPIEIGIVLLTEFVEGAAMEPEILTPGRGIVEIIPHTIPIRAKPEFSLSVISKIAENATIIKTKRGEVKIFAENFLEFIDNIV